MEHTPIILACATDRNFAQPLGVMLASVGANLSRDSPLIAYIVDLGIQPEERDMIERAAAPWRMRIEWIEESMAKYGGLPLWGRMTAATYAKLDLAELLPHGTTRAIWLDCDLVVTTDLARLWAEPLGNHLLLAATDEVVSTVSSTGGVQACKALGMPTSAPYFNAGVMLLDLLAWKREQVRERALDYLRTHGPEVYFWDQEALNVAAVGRWRALDARWNLNASVPIPGRDLRLYESDRAPWIVHYTGQLKPWTFAPPTRSLRQLYFRYLDMTPWSGWRPNRSLRTTLVRGYEVSGVRRVLYPLERLAMRLSRRWSRHAAVSNNRD
ncbi:MAG: glycosyltransferase family 8 protein [Gemmatimonadaceae bacterium]|nr:glycosyltransferase family 8 protein [Gemmatimonadaceae bacterium]